MVFTQADSCKFEKIIHKNEKNFCFAYYLLTPNPIKHEK
jgi:hypothetical protein